MAISSKQIVSIVISLIVIATILPMGLGLVASAGNVLVSTVGSDGNMTSVALSTVVDPAVLTLLTVLVPILVVVSVAMYFIPKQG